MSASPRKAEIIRLASAQYKELRNEICDTLSVEEGDANRLTTAIMSVIEATVSERTSYKTAWETSSKTCFKILTEELESIFPIEFEQSYRIATEIDELIEMTIREKMDTLECGR